MELNIPDIVAEVREAFMRYEQALVTNDVATLDACFWTSPHTIRYGLGENLYGIEAIRGFRNGRSNLDLTRELGATIITTFGRDAATGEAHGSSRTGRRGRLARVTSVLPRAPFHSRPAHMHARTDTTRSQINDADPALN